MNPLLNVVTVMFDYYHFRTKHIICLQFSSLVFLRLFSFFFVASGLENEADVQPSQSSITCHLRLQLPIISAAFDGQDENRRFNMSL